VSGEKSRTVLLKSEILKTKSLEAKPFAHKTRFPLQNAEETRASRALALPLN
jgi:hypothetical protein